MSDAPADARTIGANAIGTFVARTAGVALSVVVGIIIAKMLGPAGKGVYSGVQTMLAVPLAVSSGAGAAIVFLMTKERRNMRQLFPALTVAFLALTAALWAGMIVWSALRGWTVVTIAIVAVAPGAILFAWQPAYYIATGRMQRMNYQTVAVSAATLAAVAAALFVAHAGIAGVLGAWIAVTYAFAAIVVVDAVRQGGRLHRTDLRRQLHDVVRMGGQSALNSALGVLNYRVDSLVLVGMLGFASFGIYSIAVSFGEMLFMLTRPVTAAVTREIGRSDRGTSAEISARTIRISVAVAACASIVSFIAGPWLIDHIYGTRFSEAAAPLRWLLPGIVAFTSAGTFAAFFLFQIGRPLIVTVVNVAMIAVQVAGCVVLVPRMGMAGAALASSATYLVGASFNTWWFCRLSGYRPSAVWVVRRQDLRAFRNVLKDLLARRRKRAPKPAPMPANGRPRLLITGAGGAVGTLIRKPLSQLYALRSSDVGPVANPLPGEEFVRADIRRLRQMRKAVRGMDAVLHLGAISKEAPFDKLLDHNVRGTYTVLEAARLEGVRRVIFASTGHVTGFYPREQKIDETAPLRPDGLYAVSKVFGEALARLYADKYGLEIFCIRIGHVCAKPEHPVDEGIWLSPADFVQLVKLGVEKPDLQYEVVYGTSDNVRRWWSLRKAQSFGFISASRCDGYPAPPAASARAQVAQTLQGDAFAAAGFIGSIERITSSSERPERALPGPAGMLVDHPGFLLADASAFGSQTP